MSHWACAHRLGGHRGLTEHPLSLGTRLPLTFRSLLSAFSFLTSETLWFSCWFWLIAPPIHTFQKALSSRVLFSVKSLSRRCCAPSESQSPPQCWRCLRAGPSLFWGLFTQPLMVHAPWFRPGPCSCDFPLSPSLQPLQCEAAQSHSICNPALFVLNTTHCHPGYNPFTCFRLSDCPPPREDEPLLQISLAYHCVSTPVLTRRTQKHQHLLAGWGRTHCRQGSGVTDTSAARRGTQSLSLMLDWRWVGRGKTGPEHVLPSWLLSPCSHPWTHLLSASLTLMAFSFHIAQEDFKYRAHRLQPAGSSWWVLCRRWSHYEAVIFPKCAVQKLLGIDLSP